MPHGLKTQYAARDVYDFNPKQATGTVVGPGTYGHLPVETGESGKPCPFGSSGKRPPMSRWNSTTVTPSPDAYAVRRAVDSPPSIWKHAPSDQGFGLSQCSFNSIGKRMSPYLVPGSSVFVPSTIRDNPGPGDYEAVRDNRYVGDLKLGSRATKDLMPPAAPILSTTPSSPAIALNRDPAKSKYSGRDGDSLGPGEYDVQHRFNVRVSNFAASDAGRSLYPPTASIDSRLADPEFPSPSEYNVIGQLSRGTDVAFKSTTPQISVTTKNDNPGPGTYILSEGVPANTSDAKDLAFPGLRSTSSRAPAEWWQSGRGKTPFTTPGYLNVPGPGHYPTPATTFPSGHTRRARSSGHVMARQYHAVHTPQQVMALRDSDGGPLCAFQSTELMPRDKVVDKPGYTAPGDYDPDESMGQSISSYLKERAPIGVKGVFGTVGDRFHGFALASKELGPGPGAYEGDRVVDENRFTGTQPGMSAFKSKIEQRPEEKAMADGQSPGQYEAFVKVDYRGKFRKRATEHLSFGLGHSRWDPREVFVGTFHNSNPGPGGYDPLKPGQRPKNMATSSQSRLPSTRDDVSLGPGMYEVTSSFKTGTFNVAGETHARRLQGKSNTWDALRVTGGGAGGGVAAQRARLQRLSGSGHAASAPRMGMQLPSTVAGTAESAYNPARAIAPKAIANAGSNTMAAAPSAAAPQPMRILEPAVVAPVEAPPPQAHAAEGQAPAADVSAAEASSDAPAEAEAAAPTTEADTREGGELEPTAPPEAAP